MTDTYYRHTDDNDDILVKGQNSKHKVCCNAAVSYEHNMATLIVDYSFKSFIIIKDAFFLFYKNVNCKINKEEIGFVQNKH